MQYILSKIEDEGKDDHMSENLHRPLIGLPSRAVPSTILIAPSWSC